MTEEENGSIALGICGLNVSFSGPQCILDAIRARFHHMVCTHAEVTDAAFEYIVVPDLFQARSPFVTGDGKMFYESEMGKATYYAVEDCCRFQLDSRARAFCSMRERYCKVYLLKPAAERRWIAAHPLLTLPLLEFLKRRGIFFVHAAAFALDSRCLLLPGPSGSGKSTLTVALLLEGFSYMGDDLAMLDGEGAERVLAMPERISLTDSTTQWFQETAEVTSTEPGFPKHEMSSTTWSKADVCWQATPAALVFPNIAHTAKSVLLPISKDEALSLLASNLLLTEMGSTQRHLDALTALTKTVPAFRLQTGTDLKRVAGMMRSLLS